jgi:hypothetical protein
MDPIFGAEIAEITETIYSKTKQFAAASAVSAEISPRRPGNSLYVHLAARIMKVSFLNERRSRRKSSAVSFFCGCAAHFSAQLPFSFSYIAGVYSR